MPLVYELHDVFRTHSGGVIALQFNVTGTLVASGDATGHIFVWDRNNAERVFLKEDLGSPVVAIEWLKYQGDTVLCGTRRGQIFMFTLNPVLPHFIAPASFND